MKVILYNVGRNLNRAFRTCFSFGVSELYLIGSMQYKLKGNLFKSKDKVKIIKLETMPELEYDNSIAFENYYKKSIYNFKEWRKIDTILIGGETTGLPKGIKCNYKIKIPTMNSFCLTVEATLAIVLFEWRRYVDAM